MHMLSNEIIVTESKEKQT